MVSNRPHRHKFGATVFANLSNLMSSGGMAVENETPAKLLEEKSSMFSKLGEQSLTNVTTQSKTTYFAMKESFFSFFL
jgi:hypothetical protein